MSPFFVGGLSSFCFANFRWFAATTPSILGFQFCLNDHIKLVFMIIYGYPSIRGEINSNPLNRLGYKYIYIYPKIPKFLKSLTGEDSLYFITLKPPYFSLVDSPWISPRGFPRMFSAWTSGSLRADEVIFPTTRHHCASHTLGPPAGSVKQKSMAFSIDIQ